MYKHLIVLSLLFFSSCSQKKQPLPTSLSASGSSFSLPFTDRLFKKYKNLSLGSVSYKVSDSFQGIESFLSNNTDFTVSIAPLSDQQLADNPPILHIPVAVAGINFAYNIPGDDFQLNTDPVYLTEELVAQILLKKITNWNDPKITAINKKVSSLPDRTFPDLPITVFRREGSSGDTLLLTKFLSKANKEWANKIGVTNSIDFVGIGSSNALDVMRNTMSTPGAFSYTTMIYGIQNNIPLIRVKNKLGRYVRGCNFRSLEAMKAASPSSDNRVDLTYPDTNPEAAVAAGFIYILVKQEQNYNNRSLEQAQALVNLIDWLLSPQAQQELDPIFFSHLTPEFRNAAKNTLSKITYSGETLSPSNTKQ